MKTEKKETLKHSAFGGLKNLVEDSRKEMEQKKGEKAISTPSARSKKDSEVSTFKDFIEKAKKIDTKGDSLVFLYIDKRTNMIIDQLKLYTKITKNKLVTAIVLSYYEEHKDEIMAYIKQNSLI